MSKLEALRLEEAIVEALGAATELRSTIGSPQPVPESRVTEQAAKAARAKLGEEAWTAAVAVGRALPLAQVVAEALGEPVK